MNLTSLFTLRAKFLRRALLCALTACLILVWCGTEQAGAAFLRNRQATSRAEDKKPPLRQETFQGQILLSGKPGALLSYPLPESVYKKIRRQDFRDICVFDANGTPVPFHLNSPAKEETRQVISAGALPFFPWQGGTPERQAPSRTDVEINASNGSIIRIQSSGQAGAEKTPSAILLDLQPLLEKIISRHNTTPAETWRGVTLRMQPQEAQPFFTTVSIQGSEDLNSWRAVGSRQALARFSQGENKVENLLLTLPPNLPRYLLIRFEDEGVKAATFSAEAVLSESVISLQESVFEGVLGPDAHYVDYDLEGIFPLYALNFDLPGAEMMAVHLFAAELSPQKYSGKDQPGKLSWFAVASGTIYRLEKGGEELHNPPFEITKIWQGKNRWRISAQGDIPFAAPPALRAQWAGHSLLFLARGQGPWTLAFGRDYPVDAPSLPLAALGAAAPAEQLKLATAPSQAQPNDAAKPAQGQDSGNPWLLWVSLSLAVIFLTGLAVYLMRGMNRKERYLGKR